MLLQLKELFEIEGQKKDFSCEITANELAYLKAYSFSEPIRISGVVENRTGVVYADYECEFVLNETCDRCLKEFKREYNYRFSHILVRSINSESDEYIVCRDNALDLNELAVSDILLSLPSKILCREDCRGLCFVCGADLNEGDCEHMRTGSDIIS